MTSAPRVSVILPVYNAAPYLTEALDSVLAQSFTDFELLAHDDGSTDASLAILQDYAARDPRMVVTSEPNKGIVPVLNQLIDAARGDLIARMDADDICLPDRFEKQVGFLEGNPDCLLVGGAWVEIDGAGRKLRPVHPPLDHARLDDNNLRGTSSICHPAVMMRRQALRSLGGYNTDFVTVQDLDLWLRLAEVGRIANLPDVLLRYRLHEGGISSRKAELQADLTRRACSDAWARRGVTASFDYTPWRMDDTRASRRDYFIKYGWDAWNWGYRDTWRHYALKSVRTDPLSLPAWKLLIFGALRRPTRKEIR